MTWEGAGYDGENVEHPARAQCSGGLPDRAWIIEGAASKNAGAWK